MAPRGRVNTKRRIPLRYLLKVLGGADILPLGLACQLGELAGLRHVAEILSLRDAVERPNPDHFSVRLGAIRLGYGRGKFDHLAGLGHFF